MLQDLKQKQEGSIKGPGGRRILHLTHEGHCETKWKEEKVDKNTVKFAEISRNANLVASMFF